VRGRTRWAKVRHSQRTVKRTPTEGREESCEGQNMTGKGQTLTYCEEDADGGQGGEL
jgi:hypothetical protein